MLFILFREDEAEKCPEEIEIFCIKAQQYEDNKTGTDMIRQPGLIFFKIAVSIRRLCAFRVRKRYKVIST